MACGATPNGANGTGSGAERASVPERHAQRASVPTGLVGHGHDELHHGQHQARQQEGKADPADDPAPEAEVLRAGGALVRPCLLLQSRLQAAPKHGGRRLVRPC